MKFVCVVDYIVRQKTRIGLVKQVKIKQITTGISKSDQICRFIKLKHHLRAISGFLSNTMQVRGRKARGRERKTSASFVQSKRTKSETSKLVGHRSRKSLAHVR